MPGHTLTLPSGATTTVLHGVRYTYGRVGSGRYITWARDGHTCVIAGRQVDNRTLLTLARGDESATV